MSSRTRRASLAPMSPKDPDCTKLLRNVPTPMATKMPDHIAAFDSIWLTCMVQMILFLRSGHVEAG